MQASTELNGSDCEPPDVPAPGVLAMLGIAAIIARRKRGH
jgi:MYXO-CTERM domain-containing protein